ncbi:MAG TPA: cytochrome c3 family protein [Gemmatimonadales bacterium]|nr:cytochrome c3 family protein [Gemmatimonadales bacterium]
MTADPAPRHSWTRIFRILVPVAVLAVILMTVGTVGFIEYSAQPGFCKSCHNMVPYYDSWAESSHREVPCIQCHYAPGIKAEAMGKLQAANQVVKYVTGSYGIRPWAEIEDAACLRSGCHSERKVEGTLDYNGVAFEHAAHLGELRRGKQLRCTSCHSQIVQGEHVAVTPSTCTLCHFKDRPVGQPLAGCVGCHPSPPRVVSTSGYEVDHARYVADQVSCISCHGEVTRGTGAAERQRCFVCHNEPERIGEFENTALVHEVHITERKVECDQCHSLIEHRIIRDSTVVELDCKSCHTSAHDAQLRLYTGLGGHRTEPVPSKMYQARVSCLGCHEQTARLRGHERVQIAGEASCLSCHGVQYNNILPSWQREMDQRVARVAPVVVQARAVLTAAGARQRPVADSLLRLAEENLDLVRTGRPAHNVAFADELLRASLGLVREAVRAGRLSYTVPVLDLGPRVEETTCAACHLGIERSTVTFSGGGQFPHEPHAIRAGLSCDQCHTPYEAHGGTRITSQASCQACHHQSTEPATCVNCHRSAPTGKDAMITLADGARFPHGAHQQALPSCNACHAEGSMKVAGFQCANCHDQHHEASRSCQSCHPGDIKSRHEGFAQEVHASPPPCSACHEAEAARIESWSPQTCTICHATKATGHYEKQARSARGCEACHDLKAITGG